MSAHNTVPCEPARTTAYYYADLERLRSKHEESRSKHEENRPRPEVHPNAADLSDYVEAGEIFKEPPRVRPARLHKQTSLPEYPERVVGETYSTAGTIPLPEQKEKEPLLAELEIVGRLPLNQLETSSVRRSRSWYLCCPNVGDDEISRESSWRYSSLRPVTAPPLPNQNNTSLMVIMQVLCV